MSISNDLTRLANCKIEIKTAIEEKGVPVDTEQFELYPDYIRAIEGGGGGGDEWKAAFADAVMGNKDIAMQQLMKLDKDPEYGPVTSIGANAFANSGISEVVLPNVTTLGVSAFYNCLNLAHIELPKLEVVEARVFQDCPQVVEDLYFPNLRRIDNYAFSCMGSTGRIQIGDKTPHSAGEGINEIGYGAFQGLRNVKEIYLWYNPGSPYVATMRSDFQNNYYLRRVEIPYIGSLSADYMFVNCPNLETVVLLSPLMLGQGTFLFGTATWLNIDLLHCNLREILFQVPNQEEEYGIPVLTQVPVLNGNLMADEDEYILPENYSIVVPDALYDEWIAATNWVQYADHIVKFSEYNA